jgi:hypothetical protein
MTRARRHQEEFVSWRHNGTVRIRSSELGTRRTTKRFNVGRGESMASGLARGRSKMTLTSSMTWDKYPASAADCNLREDQEPIERLVR